MTALIIGIILFAGIHLFSIFFPAGRDGYKARWGEQRWKGFYSLVSLIGLVVMIIGYWQSRREPPTPDIIYDPPVWARHVTMTLVLIAFILLASSHGKGHIRKALHNPMSIGIVLWSTGHLLANGERGDLLLFGTFLVLGIADIAMSELRGKRPAYEPRIRSDIVAVVAGSVLYLVFLFGFHPYVLGVPIVS